MFESMTYENILESLLKKVPSDVDKREGSIIFDALSPVALEIAQMYIDLEIVLENAFADTAEREYLILRAKERGISPYDAKRALLKMEVEYSGSSENVKPGDRFSLNGLNYVVIEQMINDTDDIITTYPFDGDPNDNEPGQAIAGWWKVECETKGVIGNSQFGNLLPLQTIDGLTKAELTELLIPGEEIEDTEKFRERYFELVNNEAFGGNRADYKKWLKENGAGMVKLIRTPESGGTVGVIIANAENDIPSNELLNEIKAKLDPVAEEGMGAGIAPIGHIVDVKGVDNSQLIINVTWQLIENADENSVCLAGAEILKNYLKKLNEKWEDSDYLTVNSYQLMAQLSELNEISDITELTINGKKSITLKSNEIFDFNYIVFNGGEY